MRAGLIVHSAAGRGEAAIRELLPILFSRLGGVFLLIVSGTVDFSVAKEEGMEFAQVDIPVTDDFAFIERAVEAMLEREVDALIGVGGDGTLCAIANTIVAKEANVPLLGIGAGSSNVGPLVTIRGSDVERLNLSSLVDRPIHGIDVRVNNEHKGIAFNDVTFSNIFFGTVDGARVDLDARAMIAGRKMETQPRSVCGKKTRVSKNGLVMIDGLDTQMGQIIASPINDALPYSGKAVSGLMCWGPYLGKEGVLTMASSVLIRTHIDQGAIEAVEPLTLRQISFGDGDSVEVAGLEGDAALIVDGTPICALTPFDRVALSLRRSVLHAYRT
ncbi:NAD(+)/NADH kinase [Candidatus Bipolaricaulota bacterium]|nr:NAD(+)/NADH kinase [Candidatus Bipolaricaulota bacterium]